MKKIAIILNNQGLEYDDRIRKESLSLLKYGKAEIFVLLPGNIKETGVTSYGVPYRSFNLKSRELIPSGKFTLLKSLEFYFRVKKYLKGFDVVWVCDEEPFLFPLMYNHKKIIWDLHELPMRFERNFFMRALIRRIENRVYRIIHANPHRKDYLFKKKLFIKNSKHLVLRNYPDKIFINSTEIDLTYENFKKWLNRSEYVYLQGLGDRDRYPVESVEAVLKAGDLKAVVVGRFDADAKEYLIKKYGNVLAQRIFFSGKVDQMLIANYVRGAKFSIVLYELGNANNRLCEPNRMYQSIVMDKPVVVGCNEPMKDIVEKYGFGIVMKSDGSNVIDLNSAINDLVDDYPQIIENIEKNKNKIMWPAQEIVFEELITSFIPKP